MAKLRVFFLSQIQSLPEAQEGLIWSRSLNESVHLSKWASWLDQQEAQLETTKLRLQRQWRARVNDEEFGPAPYGDLEDRTFKGRNLQPKHLVSALLLIKFCC